MSRFAALIKGFDNETVVDFVLPGATEPIKVGVRPLPGWDEAEVLREARAFAIERGVEKPTDDDPIYVTGCWVYTILRAYVVHQGDEKGQPFFADAAEILKHLDRDRIAYLFEHQRRVQEDFGCRKERISQAEMIACTHDILTKEVGDAEIPFFKWGPAAQGSYLHFLVSLLFVLPQDKLPFGLSSSRDLKSSEAGSDNASASTT